MTHTPWILGAAWCLLACGVSAQDDAPTYRVVEGQPVQLDVVTPTGPTAGLKRPGVVCIHGGGWQSGSRDQYRSRLTWLAERGFVAFSLDYRLVPDVTWPAPWDDVKAAFAWIREHADEYGVDPDRLGVVGNSAGGQLALLSGLRQPAGGRSPARIVANFFGPADLTRPMSRLADDCIESLMGGAPKEHPQAYRDASPTTWIEAGDVPVLTFHGTDDAIVPFGQATLLHDALEAGRVPHELTRLAGVNHGFSPEVANSVWAALIERFRTELDPRRLEGLPKLELVASWDFDEGTDLDGVRFTDADAWSWKPLEQGGGALALSKKASSYAPPVRSPLHIAWLEGITAETFVLDVDVRTTHPDYGHRDLCLFFGAQDASHFYYVHLGQEADPHAHSIFAVDGAPRVSIATERTDGTPWDDRWHRVRIVRDASSGRIEVFFDDFRSPVMQAEDARFGEGQIGLGSFDDTGDFDSVRLYGPSASKNEPSRER